MNDIQGNCIHERMNKEVFMGVKTGEFVCHDCGYVADRNEMERIKTVNKLVSLKHRNIVRRDQPERSSHGWQVIKTKKGNTLTRFFSDGRYGNKLKSLIEAIQWRDCVLVGLM